MQRYIVQPCGNNMHWIVADNGLLKTQAPTIIAYFYLEPHAHIFAAAMEQRLVEGVSSEF